MTYFPNKPVGTDFLLQSQPELLQNFALSLQSWNANHITFNQDDGGKHRLTSLRKQTVDPATAADENALYSKEGIPAGQPLLFYRPHSNATPIQMTYPSVVNTGDAQYSYMAGPFIFYFGKIASATNGQIVALTPASTLITVLLQISSKKYFPVGNQNPFAQAFNVNIPPSSFQVLLINTPPASINDVYYIAVGLPS